MNLKYCDWCGENITKEGCIKKKLIDSEFEICGECDHFFRGGFFDRLIIRMAGRT